MRNIKPARRLGRPRAFEERSVIRRAQLAFLEDGYEASSYDDVGRAMGLSKPSLYNAFGDKAALFRRAIADYAQAAREQILASFKTAASLREGGRALLLAAADVYSRPDGGSIGCLLIGTSLPAAVRDEAVRDTLSKFIATLEGALEETIAARFADDARRSGKTPRQLAMHLSSLLFSLAIRARMGLSRRQLRSIAGELADLFV
jgi:TetR/AcrR family transcriptional regulator, copper-responsive repressor